VLQGQPLFNDVREIGLWLELTSQAGSEQCGEVPEGYAVSGVVLYAQVHSKIEAGKVNLNQGISASSCTPLGPSESENGLEVWPK
jgi:hypothetical protein